MENRVLEIISEQTEFAIEDINKSNTLESLDIDSLELSSVVMEIEDKYDLTIDEEIHGKTTIQELIEIVNKSGE